MRIKILLLVLFLSATFGDLDFYSRLSNFSVDLLYNTVRDTDANVVISPYGVWSLLISMAYETSGITREQVSKVFSLPEDRSGVVQGLMDLKTSLLEKRGVNFSLYNILFYDQNDFHVISDGLTRLENDFHFYSKPLNFWMPKNAADDAWLYFMRLGFRSVANIVRAEDFVNSSMIMCNYMTFDAKWAYPFNQVREVDYYDTMGERMVTVNEMSTTMPARFSYFNFGSMTISVTEVPFEGGDKFCMLYILPLYGTSINSADEVYKNLRKITLMEMFSKLEVADLEMREVPIKLPKCQFDSHVILNKPLTNMGLFSAFDDTANFSSFAEDDVYISEIAHRVKIAFTDSHVRVYTTTPAYTVTPKRPKNRSPIRPIVFLILEKLTTTVLFGGSFSLNDCIPIN